MDAMRVVFIDRHRQHLREQNGVYIRDRDRLASTQKDGQKSEHMLELAEVIQD